MSQQFPQYKASELSDFGIRFRKIDSRQSQEGPVRYLHQDDYYIIGLVEKGTGYGIIYFNKVVFSQGDVFLILPGQVHRFICSNDIEGWMLMVDNSFIDYEEKYIFDMFQLSVSSVPIDEQRMNELKQIALILVNRMNRITDELTKATVRRLAEIYIGIVAEVVRESEIQQVKHTRRHIEIVLSFRRLLARHLSKKRSPSDYASQLNISPVYLNEVVKKVTGISTKAYIKNSIILEAKRLLVYTNLTIKEISSSLGIDDHAYFSRIFTQATGISPSTFRKRNLE